MAHNPHTESNKTTEAVIATRAKTYNFEPPGEPSESCLKARADFLQLIAQIKPEIVAELWNKALREFQWAVIRHFAKEIFEGVGDVNAYLDEQQTKQLTSADSDYAHLLSRRLEEAIGARPNGVFELLAQQPALQAKVDEAMLRFVLAFRNGLLVHLIQRKVISDGQPDSLKIEFRDFGSVSHRPDCEKLTAIIQNWSEESNLDAAWCRDHAVAVLREWLSHPQLSSVALYESEQAMQRTGWASATTEISLASVFSRVSVDMDVYGENGPTPLAFKWRRYDLELPGYNHLKDSTASYRQKSLAAFELHAHEKRRTLLWQIANSDDEILDLYIEPYSEVLARFNKKVDKNIFSNTKTVEKVVKNFKRVKKKRALSTHLLWAVYYQVPPTKTFDEIVDLEQGVRDIEELFREKKPPVLTEKQVQAALSKNERPALELCVMRDLIHEERDDAMTRVISRLRERKRRDLFPPYEDAEHERMAWSTIEKLTQAERRTNGDYFFRYRWTGSRKSGKVPNVTTIMRGVDDVLNLIELPKRPDAKPGRIRGRKNKYQLSMLGR